MFAKATKSLVSEIDSDGVLVPVSRLNDSDGLVPLALVIKRNRYWFWQQPKFLPTDFKLNNVLVGDPIDPVVVETDFLTYCGKVVDNKGGSAAAELGPGTINIGGSGSVKLQSSFGNLKKQEVDIQKLLQDSKTRVLDLQHSLVQQTRDARLEVLTVVKECIVTTQPCTLTEEVQEVGTCTGIFGFNKTIKVSVNDKGKPFMEYDNNVSLNIPPKTTVAYSVIELEVAQTGHYELCLLPEVKGGFEVDGPVTAKRAVTVSSTPVKRTSKLHRDLEGLQEHFRALSKLPASTRCALFQQLFWLLENPAAISSLENALEDLCEGRQIEANVSPELKATLELVQKDAGLKSLEARRKPSALTAVHLIISALDDSSKEMKPDPALTGSIPMLPVQGIVGPTTVQKDTIDSAEIIGRLAAKTSEKHC
ncbi:hypothetical protein DNTS_030375 [Danionella cerebrum]|uniref:Gasdermin pore forming domain-containing protein n=1 Tax=Danionella cerebrum TaxID=2873325 RepID=A0A553QX04_9TELE|nr:hypothetical protein DNTS_030375 [Danionella translucida]